MEKIKYMIFKELYIILFKLTVWISYNLKKKLTNFKLKYTVNL